MTKRRVRGDESDNWWNDDGSWGYVGVFGPDLIIGVTAHESGSENVPQARLFIDDEPGPLLDATAPERDWRKKGIAGAKTFSFSLADIEADKPVTLSVRYERSGLILPNGGPIPFTPRPRPAPRRQQKPVAAPVLRDSADFSPSPLSDGDFASLRAHLDAGLARLEAKIDAQAQAGIAETRVGFAWLEPKLDALLKDLPRKMMISFAILSACLVGAIIVVGALLFS